MKVYKVIWGTREIKVKEFRQMDPDEVFDQFMTGNDSDNLILETESYDEAKDCIMRKMPVMRIGNETFSSRAVPVDCYWVEEFEDGEYAGTLDHSEFPEG